MNAANMQGEFWPDDSPKCDGGTTTPARSRPTPATTGETLTSFAEATHARRTAEQESTKERARRVSAVSSSGLLMSFGRALFFGRIQHECGPTLLGPSGDSEASWNALGMLCCPSDSEPVALALTTKGTGCSCLPRMPTPSANLFPCGDVAKLFTPTASDYRGSTGKGSRRNTLAEQLAIAEGANGKTVYPHPEYVEAVMRFPISWSDLSGWEMP